MVKLSFRQVRMESKPSSLPSRKLKRSNKAIVAVGSSPCICDHSITFFSPLPYFNLYIARLSTDLPISTTCNTPFSSCIFTKSATDRKSTRLNSSHVKSSYAVFCLKKKKENGEAEPQQHGS